MSIVYEQSPRTDEQARHQSAATEATPASALTTAPGALVSTLVQADPALRRQMITGLQRRHGNQFVQRVMAEVQRECAACGAEEDELQRGVVQRHLRAPANVVQPDYNVPSQLECIETVGWINTNSPHRPAWAKTTDRYTFHGRTHDSRSEEDGTHTYQMEGHGGLSVTKSVSQDMPQWTPSPRPNRDEVVAAWNAMHGALQAHEDEHVGIAETNRTTMEGLWQNVSITGTGSSAQQAEADATQQFRDTKQGWLDDSQDNQDDIDPYTAQMTCPAPPVEEEEGATGEQATAVQQPPPTPVAGTGCAPGEHA